MFHTTTTKKSRGFSLVIVTLAGLFLRLSSESSSVGSHLSTNLQRQTKKSQLWSQIFFGFYHKLCRISFPYYFLIISFLISIVGRVVFVSFSSHVDSLAEIWLFVPLHFSSFPRPPPPPTLFPYFISIRKGRVYWYKVKIKTNKKKT